MEIASARLVVQKLGRMFHSNWLFFSLLGLGIMLRVLATVAYQPAILFNGDSYFYLLDAHSLSPSSFHPLGYALFLRGLTWTGHLVFVVILQHTLGLLAAALLYGVLRKLTGRPWIAALGVVPILLDAYIISSEGMIMSESLTGFSYVVILSLSIWRAKEKVWPMVVAGCVLALAAITRSTAGLGIIPIVLFLVVDDGLLSTAKRLPTLKRAGIFVIACGIPLLVYCGYHAEASKGFTIDDKSSFFLYGRLAQIADCRELTGISLRLCDPKAVSDRSNTSYFLWDPASPLRRTLPGESYHVPMSPLKQFDTAVLSHQWPAFTASVAVETARYLKPERITGIKDDPLKDIQFPTSLPWTSTTFLASSTFTATGDQNVLPKRLPHAALSKRLAAYQRFGYISGIVLGLGVLISLVSTIFVRNRLVLIALLFITFGVLQLFSTSIGASFNYRYLLPVEELLWVGGVLSGVAMVTFLKQRRVAR